MLGGRTIIAAAMTGAVLSGVITAENAHAASATTPTGGTLTVKAADDAYVSSLRTTQNFGSAEKLVVGSVDGEVKTSYVKFATGALPAGASITGAKLNVTIDGPTAPALLSAYPVTGAWAQGTIAGGKQPAVSATASGSVLPKTSDTTLSIDVTPAVTAAGTYSFELKSASATAFTRLRSSEYAGGGPTLVLTYTDKAASTPTCVTGPLLVPTCGVLWGAAAGGFTTTPRDTALKNWETLTGRTSTIFHAYHTGDQKFPTPEEIAMTQDPAHPRILLLNWKVAAGTTWAGVASGVEDKRIDAWAAYEKANFGTKKFFLVLHHEPENDVNATAGSGMTAKDFAAMFRHTVLRLRADGVTNVVYTVAYMGNEKWEAQSWWKDLYPGDDVVDWIGLDSYVSVEPGYYHYGDFGSLLDRKPTGGTVGWYQWAATNHPSKPIMVAEWGMYHRIEYPTSKAAAYATVVPELVKHPKVKAIVYFDTASDATGDRNIAVDSTPDSLTAFQKVAADPIFNVKVTE